MPGQRVGWATAIATDLLGLLAIVVLVLANAVFVLAEFALLCADRSQLERLAQRGDGGARRTLAASRRLTFHLAGAQLGVTISSLLLGFASEPVFTHLLNRRVPGAAAVALAFVVSSALQLVLGEQVPKSLAITNPLASARWSMLPLRVWCRLFGPAIGALNSIANWCVRRLGVEPTDELRAILDVEELEVMIQSSAAAGTLSGEEARLLVRALRFSGKTVGDALVPRTTVVAVSASDSVADLLRTAGRSGFSRFPVLGQGMDDVVGLAHLRDALALEPEQRPGTRVTDVRRAATVVPRTASIGAVWERLEQDDEQLAVVIDEYGGFAGIVTVEDVLEEVVGEIDRRPVRAEAGEGRWILSGLANAETVREVTGFEMPEGAYDTLAGFLLDRLGVIPRPGDTWEEGGMRFRIRTVEGHRIADVEVLRA